MSTPLIFASLWVIVGTVVAFLPMRFQFPPGLILLIAAPYLLLWIGAEHGMWLAFAGALAFLSMFRRPLGYFARCAMGQTEEVPE